MRPKIPRIVINREKTREKLRMYDNFAANILAGDFIIEPKEFLDNDKIQLGFNSLASNSRITKYFMIQSLPDFVRESFLMEIRNTGIMPGVIVNYYIYSNGHMIKWDSAEMKNKLSIWKEYADRESGEVGVFDYRTKRDASMARKRIIWSTKYLNEMELDYKRTIFKSYIMIEVIGSRNEYGLANMERAVGNIKKYCKHNDIRLKEVRINLIDWLSYLGIFSLKHGIREVSSRVSKRIFTDDILARLNGYKQGFVGNNGVPLGMDIYSRVPVIKKLKADPDAAENWMICAETGGGKSMYIKTLLTYLLADGFAVTILDYEGDEYTSLADYVREGDSDDVKVISMGKASTEYFDPMEIADLTGDDEIDNESKENAINYTLSIFRLIIGGLAGDLTQWEQSVISAAIKRVFEKAEVTEDKSTWIRSKGLRIKMVYEEIKEMVKSKELVDLDIDNIKHKAAVKIVDAASIYFEPGEVKSGTFKNPISINELYRARLIVFSFGMRGATSTQIDPVILALKQLSVANVAIQISNYCKYVKKCFNVKVWEEFQRWGEIRGSSEIILNAMTGGRKRGDVNFLITNKLGDLLDENNPVSKGLRENIKSKVIGKINDKKVREAFCDAFSVPEIKEALDEIYKASTESSGGNYGVGSRYKYAFCLMLDDGTKAVVKVILPEGLRQSKLFKTGVERKEE